MPIIKIPPLLISAGLIFIVGGFLGISRGAAWVGVNGLWVIVGGILLASGIYTHNRAKEKK